MITLSDLEFHYPDGEFSLRIPALEIETGETVAVIGPSGTGKTSFLNLVGGVVTASTGRVVHDNTDLSSLSDAERRAFRILNIGLVFQEFELLEYLTVFDNILLPYRIHSALRLSQAVKARAAELAAEVGISQDKGRYVDQLSQGERQRVAICRALLPRPRLILADEPTGNLDPRNKGRVLDILFDYVQRERATLLTVTHDHDLLDRFERVVDFSRFHMEASEQLAPEGDPL
jgi:putative ABC transport system ATP-binding protein